VANNPASAKSEKPVLNLIHFKAAHVAYDFNEKFEREMMSGVDGFERQAYASLLLLHRLIEDMKTAGVYDNSFIVIAADHGTELKNLPKTMPRDAERFHNPLLLIKLQNETYDSMIHRTEYTNVQDITPTILELVGLPNLPGRPSGGISVFGISPDVLTQREAEYEAFWAEKRKESAAK
jgi:membrane-anchored protein YejM (alkaline phosphatase superfamily)